MKINCDANFWSMISAIAGIAAVIAYGIQAFIMNKAIQKFSPKEVYQRKIHEELGQFLLVLRKYLKSDRAKTKHYHLYNECRQYYESFSNNRDATIDYMKMVINTHSNLELLNIGKNNTLDRLIELLSKYWSQLNHLHDMGDLCGSINNLAIEIMEKDFKDQSEEKRNKQFKNIRLCALGYLVNPSTGYKPSQHTLEILDSLKNDSFLYNEYYNIIPRLNAQLNNILTTIDSILKP